MSQCHIAMLPCERIQLQAVHHCQRPGTFDIFDVVEPYESCLQPWQAAGSSVPGPLSDLSSNDHRFGKCHCFPSCFLPQSVCAFQTHEKRTKQVVWRCLLLVLAPWLNLQHARACFDFNFEPKNHIHHCRHFSVISNQAIQTDHAALTESLISILPYCIWVASHEADQVTREPVHHRRILGTSVCPKSC